MDNNKKYNISDLSPHLFWDVDRSKLDWEQHNSTIIHDVLEYGKEMDWKIIKSIYGIEHISEIAMTFRSLDDVTLHFVATISNTSIKDYRCYNTKQSAPNYFWS